MVLHYAVEFIKKKKKNLRKMNPQISSLLLKLHIQPGNMIIIKKAILLAITTRWSPE